MLSRILGISALILLAGQAAGAAERIECIAGKIDDSWVSSSPKPLILAVDGPRVSVPLDSGKPKDPFHWSKSRVIEHTGDRFRIRFVSFQGQQGCCAEETGGDRIGEFVADYLCPAYLRYVDIVTLELNREEPSRSRFIVERTITERNLHYWPTLAALFEVGERTTQSTTADCRIIPD